MMNMLNPYQKIIKDGVEIQAGDMDTPLKFQHLIRGVDLKGKRILDAGCNLGMMCQLAMEHGAVDALGIDINLDYIEQARGLFPGLRFLCLPVEQLYGSYDIIIASALLHYVKDLDAVLKTFARCGKEVLCDVWLNDSPDAVFTLTHRGMYVPSRAAFSNMAGKYFRTVEERGEALSPDVSRRYAFRLSEPAVDVPEAILIYGESGTGKSTLATTYHGHNVIRTDNLFGNWRYSHRDLMFSAAWCSRLTQGEYRADYLNWFIEDLKQWLSNCENRDIVIEGYELTFEDFRRRVKELLTGWTVKEIRLTKQYEKVY